MKTTKTKTKAKNKNGAIIYKGPSMLDGQPIVAIATGLKAGSANSKTGSMVQVWILRGDVAPSEAARTGADESVCGGCPHRGRVIAEAVANSTEVRFRNVDRTCYVLLFQGPRSVYAAYERGSYADLTGMHDAMELRVLGRNRIVRMGAYGDPAAIPAHVWNALLSDAAGWTGYTHQWRNADHLSRWCMASVDSEREHAEAEAAGWRTFRVRTTGQQLMLGERVCPASAEAGKKTTCVACQACSGGDGRGHSSIAIIAHGATARKFAA
jgi:hypothetical protein